MREKQARNLALIVAIAMPAAMIVFIMLAVFVSQAGPRPEISFLYSSGQNYYADFNYYVDEAGRLKRTPNTSLNRNNAVGVNSTASGNLRPQDRVDTTRLYVYDVAGDTRESISFEDAQKLRLDDSRKSKEGYELGYGGSNYSLLFAVFGGVGGGSSEATVTDGSRAYELEHYDYLNRANFIGWIEEE